MDILRLTAWNLALSPQICEPCGERGREPGKCEDPLNILISATDRNHPVFRPDARAVQGSQYDKWQAQTTYAVRQQELIKE